jgi:hypothetical protein
MPADGPAGLVGERLVIQKWRFSRRPSLQAFGPAGDHLAETERGRLIALD